MVDSALTGRTVVVVGAGLAGARATESLRRAGHRGPVIVVGAEPHLPYDRPPLSKDILKGTRADSALGFDPDALDVRLHRGSRAIGLNPESRVVECASSDGVAEIHYDKLIIATGADPVRLPGGGRQSTLRTIDDAVALRAELVPGARVSIIGASWIGAEVATAALAAGCHVTCVEAGGAPLANAVGEGVGRRFVDWWDDVDLRLGAQVSQVLDDGLLLGDGSIVPSDVTVTGVGVRASTSWLAGSGLELDRGVVVDRWLRAAPDIVAVGDVAAWWSANYDRHMRVGHWDNAVAGAAAAAAATLREQVLDDETNCYDPVPYFWSDQFGHKIQYVGQHDDTCTEIVRDDPDSPGWTAAWLDSRGRLTAALTVDRPRDLVAARRAMAKGAVIDEQRLADPAVGLADL